MLMCKLKEAERAFKHQNLRKTKLFCFSGHYCGVRSGVRKCVNIYDLL